VRKVRTLWEANADKNKKIKKWEANGR